jgi:hypothetical protein
MTRIELLIFAAGCFALGMLLAIAVYQWRMPHA